MNGPWPDRVMLAPLTKGGNLPFRRLCVDFGAKVTFSEMAYAGQVVRGSRKEMALLRRGATEPFFGVQFAASNPAQATLAARIALEKGADLIDLNAGCPIHEAVKKGLGACLLDRPRSLGTLLQHLVQELDCPVTVKVRTGFKESKINVLETTKIAEDAGVAGITVHGRTREQRYTRAADWDLIARVVQERRVPVAGNGDILTWYEAEDRLARSGVAALMLARGALIKPWLFQEIAERRELAPTGPERVAIYRRLATYLTDYFGEDEYGQKRAREFLTWHLGFFHRYRPLPPEEWLERSREHPLLQTRLPDFPSQDPLDLLLASPEPDVHARLADALLQARDDAEAVALLRA